MKIDKTKGIIIRLQDLEIDETLIVPKKHPSQQVGGKIQQSLVGGAQSSVLSSSCGDPSMLSEASGDSIDIVGELRAIEKNFKEKHGGKQPKALEEVKEEVNENIETCAEK